MYLSWISRPGLPGHFFALAAGAVLPFSFAPYFWWPLGIISCALLFLSLHTLNGKQALWRGWWYGLGLYASGVSWVYISIHVHSHTPAPLAALFTFIFVAGLAWFFALMAFAYRKWFALGSLNFLTFAALWVGFEWLRSWFLTGFPWLFLGDAHLNTPLKGLAPIFGVYGISFVVVLSATALVTLLLKHRTQPLAKALWVKASVALLSPWVVAALLNAIHWTAPLENGELNVVAVQGNIPQERKWLSSEIYPTLEKYRGASQEHWHQADVVLWPETAITVLRHQAKEYIQYLGNEARDTNTTLITGIPYQQQQNEPYPGAFHNSIVAIGTGSGVYHKQKLVPFGEYLPLPDQARSLLEFFNIPMSDFRRGEPEQAILQAHKGDIEYGIAPFICYEVVYPDFVANMAKQSGLMVTISNDAWFGRSNGPLQHMAMARMRALETGRYLLRATNTGVTALIDPKGNVVARLPQFEFGALNANAHIMTGSTPFMLWGSWPMVLAVVGILGFARWRLRQLSVTALAR